MGEPRNPPLDGQVHAGRRSSVRGPPGMNQLPNHLVLVVAFCALLVFVKRHVELLGRSEDRRFRSDPSLVSAVIASRNGAALLDDTIDELKAQLQPERIIVVDDGSADGTADV